MCSLIEGLPREHYIDDSAPNFENSPLLRARNRPPDPDPEPESSSTCAWLAEYKPDLQVLQLGHLLPPGSGSSEELSEEVLDTRRAMPEPSNSPPGGNAQSLHNVFQPSAMPMPSPAHQEAQLQQTAAEALHETGKATPDVEQPVRIDSALEVPQVSGSQQIEVDGKAPSLKVQTGAQSSSDINVPPSADSIVNSPILRKNMIQILGSTKSTPAVVQPPTSPAFDPATHTSRKESLPRFQDHLQRLADRADNESKQLLQQDTRAISTSRTHSHSFGSAASPSPILPYYANSAQTSPVNCYQTYGGGNARSPTSTTSERTYYGSPGQFQGQAYYSDRRSSTATEDGRPLLRPVPSLPSQSSGESHGTTSSSTDGYSTAHSTPTDPPFAMDDLPRRILPPPRPGMSIPPAAGFQCDYPGCGALPFPTQYLLSSHLNVHSQIRSHYCPVQECPRSQGGKGFKRKNEMIRHGLVHSSPGYVCPFCPEREHRYPRPDNLQRHVRQHHVDKKADDAALREVLAQRSEGAVQKQRRRRAQGSSSSQTEGS